MTAYRIDPHRSEVYIQMHSNVHPIEIRTQGLSGTIEAEVGGGSLLLAPSPRARMEISADLLRSGIELYDKEFHRMLEVQRHPTIRCELRETREVTTGRYRVIGTLSLHGVTRDIDGEVTARVRGAGANLEIEVDETIDVRDFNIQLPKILMLEVQPDVAIRAKIRAVRS